MVLPTADADASCPEGAGCVLPPDVLDHGTDRPVDAGTVPHPPGRFVEVA